MKLIFAIVFLISCQTFAAAKTLYKLKFNPKPPLDFTAQVFELSPTFLDKVGTNGTIEDTKQLQPLREFKNSEIELTTGQTVILALVFKSPKKLETEFYVAPHHIHPAEVGLDFKFNCLCYNHIYKMEKGKLWYRIMRLSQQEEVTKSKTIVLTHDVLPNKKH